MSITSNAQTTLSQTGGASPVTGTGPNTGSVSCQSSQNNQISDNSYYRAYTMTNSFTINAVRVGVKTVVGSVPIEVVIHERTAAFPGSHPSGSTVLASGTYTLTSADNGKLVDVLLTTPITAASGAIIVAEVKNQAATAPNNNYAIGVVSGPETASAYITSNACSLTTPQTIASLNVANASPKIIIDLLNIDPASSTDFFNSNFILYPNPTSDVLNISSKNGLVASEIRITDMTGKIVKVQKDASTVNVSNLASGTYLIDITTKEGKASSKFVKK